MFDPSRKGFACASIAVLVGWMGAARATQYPLASADALMFGENETITAFGEDTLPDLARRYSLGYEEIRSSPDPKATALEFLIVGYRILQSG